MASAWYAKQMARANREVFETFRYYLDETRSAEYQRRTSLLVVIGIVVMSAITIALFVVFPI